MPEWSAKSIEMRDTATLNPYERNPRTHPESQIEQLKNSIRQWGWTVPILIDEDDTVLAGHGRLHAATEMGIEQVPCVVATGWSEDQKRAYVIADNQLAENSNWDTARLLNELKDINESGFDISMTGFDGSLGGFEPSMEPTFKFKEVTDLDVSNAQGKMDEKIDGLQREKADDGVEVMCPHCAGTFTVAGY